MNQSRVNERARDESVPSMNDPDMTTSDSQSIREVLMGTTVDDIAKHRKIPYADGRWLQRSMDDMIEWTREAQAEIAKKGQALEDVEDSQITEMEAAVTATSASRELQRVHPTVQMEGGMTLEECDQWETSQKKEFKENCGKCEQTIIAQVKTLQTTAMEMSQKAEENDDTDDSDEHQRFLRTQSMHELLDGSIKKLQSLIRGLS